MKAVVCGKYGSMTALKRHELPDRAFGLPKKRSYPMPDPIHAKNAKARASQEYNRGRLSKREFDQINERADKVIASCAGSSKLRTKGLGRTTAVHWNTAQAKKYRAEVRKCISSKRCNSKSGKSRMSCARACKSTVSRKVSKKRK